MTDSHSSDGFASAGRETEAQPVGPVVLRPADDGRPVIEGCYVYGVVRRPVLRTSRRSASAALRCTACLRSTSRPW